MRSRCPRWRGWCCSTPTDYYCCSRPTVTSGATSSSAHVSPAPIAVVEAAIHDQPGCVLGGFSAAVAHAGGNRIAAYQEVLVYGTPVLEGFEPAPADRGIEVLIAEGDPWVGRHGGVTTFAQAWADLFCMPGWQAARFVDQLDPKEVAARDEPLLLV